MWNGIPASSSAHPMASATAVKSFGAEQRPKAMPGRRKPALPTSHQTSAGPGDRGGQSYTRPVASKSLEANACLVHSATPHNGAVLSCCRVTSSSSPRSYQLASAVPDGLTPTALTLIG